MLTSRKPAPLRAASRQALLACLILAMVASAADSGAGGFFAPLELARSINTDPGCTRILVLGTCWCGNVPCGVRVAMYVPVAFVETVQKPGDSLLALPPGLQQVVPAGPPGTGSSRQHGLDNTSEVHAWALSDAVWQASSLAACAVCRPSDAWVPVAPVSMPRIPGCDPPLISFEAVAAATLNGPLPVLVYASEADPLNWRSGCRDAARPPLAALTQPGQGATIGNWGPLYPRQMRDLGTTGAVYSAKTAYRALSIARDPLGSFKAPVDLAARMQQAFPVASACFAVGDQPLPEDSNSSQPVRTSADGRYGWFYWRPVTCCVSTASLAQCGGH